MPPARGRPQRAAGRVITLLAQGLNQDAIAASIGVSTRKSVENYLRDAIFKLSQPESGICRQAA